MKKIVVLVLVLFVCGLAISAIKTKNIVDFVYLLVVLGFIIKIKSLV